MKKRRRMVTIEKYNDKTGKWEWVAQHFDDKAPALIEEYTGWGWKVRIAPKYQHVSPL